MMRFTAPDSGSFRIFCGVPGHGLSGHVDPVHGGSGGEGAEVRRPSAA